MRRLIGVVVVLMLMLATPAHAAPLPTPGTNGPVRAMLRVGSQVWIGGQFDTFAGRSTGALATIAQTLPRLNGSVFDMSLSDGVVYVAGTFTYQGGANLVGISTAGVIVRRFSTTPLRSVLASGGVIYAGGARIIAIDQSGWVAPKLAVNVVRHHPNPPQARDMVMADGDLWVTCVCDVVERAGVTYPVRTLIRLDPLTGALIPFGSQYSPPALMTPSLDNMKSYGESLAYRYPYLYLGAGGTDFTIKFDVRTGQQLWREDTTGSSQVVSLFGDSLIVGGHFRWAAIHPGLPCSPGIHPANCVFQPRLIMLDPITGSPAYHSMMTPRGPRNFANWSPAICCEYNGVWALLPATHLWVGGTFGAVSHGWLPEAAKVGIPVIGDMAGPIYHRYNLEVLS